MPTAKDANVLVSYFEKGWKEKYGKKPNVNRYTARWAMDSILGQMSIEDAKSLIDYYFTTISDKGHSFNNFIYNYEKYVEAKESNDTDQAQLAELREKTRIRTEEWRKKVGNDRGEGN